MTTPCSLCGGPLGERSSDAEGLGARLCATCLPPEAARALARSSQEQLLTELSQIMEDPDRDGAPAAPRAGLRPVDEVPSQLDEALPLAAFRRAVDEGHPVLLQEFLETLTLEQQATLRAGVTRALQQRLGLGRPVDPERIPPAWDRIERWAPDRRLALAHHLADLPGAKPVIEWIASLQGPGERALPPRAALGYEVLRRLGDRVRQIHTRAVFGKALLRAERARLREALEHPRQHAARLETLQARITRIDRDQLPVYEGWIQEVADLCEFFESTKDTESETRERARARRTALRLAHSAAFTDLLEEEERQFLRHAVVPALGGKLRG